MGNTYLPQTNKDRQLTEKQQKFLAALFDEAGGDARLAKKMAGLFS